MSAPPLPPGCPALFLAVRRGLPLATAALALLCAAVLPGLRGWCLLTAVAALVTYLAVRSVRRLLPPAAD